jgi:hypothetical protein
VSDTICPSLSLLRHAISPQIQGIEASLIQDGPSPSAVYRVRLHYAEPRRRLSSVIVKAVKPNWPDDPFGADREYIFYTRFLPHLDLGHAELYYAGIDKATHHRILVMQDLSPDYRFPPANHPWSEEETRCLLRVYARLHTHGRALLPEARNGGWLMPPYQERLANERIPGMADELQRIGVWPSIPGLGRLFERTRANVARLDSHANTLLHNDVYPPNVALPANLDDEAILIDWAMLSWGLAELDLAYLFMQPFRSTRLINRAEAQNYYWKQRQLLGDDIHSSQERAARQRHSDAVLALALTPVAYACALRPFPVNSAPWRYWNSMHRVLGERLAELSEESA